MSCSSMCTRQWSDLPLELMEKIAEKDQSDSLRRRIRGVCKSWRCSIPSLNNYFTHDPPSPFLVSFPSGLHEKEQYNLAALEVIVVVLHPLKPYHNNKGGILKLKQTRSGKLRPMNPLLPKQRISKRNSISEVINLLDYRVQLIHRCHVVRGKNRSGRVTKVVVSGGWICALYGHDHHDPTSGWLGFLKFGEKNWSKLEGRFQDVAVYKEKFYALGNEGARLVTIDPLSLKVSKIVKRLEDYVQFDIPKYLVESAGDLFLVVKDKSYFYGYTFIHVFKVDEEQGQWIDLDDDSAGDRMFFVGDPECSFSLTSRDLPREMCMKKLSHVYYKHEKKRGGLFIERAHLFDYDSSSYVPLSASPDAMNIFWNPRHRKWRTNKTTIKFSK